MVKYMTVSGGTMMSSHMVKQGEVEFRSDEEK